MSLVYMFGNKSPSAGGGGTSFSDGFEVAAWPSWNGATNTQDNVIFHEGANSMKSVGDASAGDGGRIAMGFSVDTSIDTLTVTNWIYRAALTNPLYLRIFSVASDTGYMWTWSSGVKEIYRCTGTTGFTLLDNPNIGNAGGWSKHEVIFSSTGFTYNVYDAGLSLLDSFVSTDTTYQNFDEIGCTGAVTASTYRLDEVSAIVT